MRVGVDEPGEQRRVSEIDHAGVWRHRDVTSDRRDAPAVDDNGRIVGDGAGFWIDEVGRANDRDRRGRAAWLLSVRARGGECEQRECGE
jgi:hypothetical protein